MKKGILFLLVLSIGGSLTGWAQIGTGKTTPTRPATKPATATKVPLKAAPAAAPATLTLTTQKEKVSYSIGMDIGRTLKTQEMDVDPAIVSRGLRDFMEGKKLLLSDPQIQESMNTLRQEMMARQQQRMKESAGKNQLEGEKFLAENKIKEGVVTLPSSLQYKILVEGTGPMPKTTDTVVTHYRGTLLDGSEFDSSFKNQQPVSFPVNRVIPGWTEALQLMRVGSKWQLFVPASLAYGENSPGPEIPPNSTLIFELELLEIK